MQTEQCDQALGYWTVGLQYINLVENILEETIQQGNTRTVISASPLSWDEVIQQTKWSDHTIIIPTLFNLFHGFELFLKGFLIASGNPLEDRNHKLSELLSLFETQFSNHTIGIIIKKYVLQEHLPLLLSKFCKASNISIDDYYQALKYPESLKGKAYSHYPLKYQGESGLPFFELLQTDLNTFVKSAVALSRSICPSA